MQRSFQSVVKFIAQSVGSPKNILNRGTFQCRTSRNIEKPASILEASFAVALGNVQWNRLRRAKPLIAGVTVRTGKFLGDGER